MDLMYLPDAFTFHVIRSPAYDAREYLDAAWDEEEDRLRRQKRKGSNKKGAASKASSCPRSSNTAAGSEASGSGKCVVGSPRRGSSGGGKDSCPMCKERKRRTLATYIRTKSREDSECTIEEEGEEEEGAAVGCSVAGAAPEGGCPLRTAEDKVPQHCA